MKPNKKTTLKFKLLFVTGFFVLFPNPTSAALEDHFVTTWKTDNAGSSSSTAITIPTISSGYNYDVDWDNDGTFDQTGITGNVTHDFGTPGTYTIRIQGAFPHIFFNNALDRNKILSVDQWGTNVWRSMKNSFYGASNVTIPATDAPNLSTVTDISWMFHNATSFNQPINHWDVSNVRTMSTMFNGATAFNQPLDTWDTSSLISTSYMFSYSAFNQDISSWDMSDVISAADMFREGSLSRQNYDAILEGWSSRSVQPNLNLDSNATYCATAARSILTSAPNNWTISDGGEANCHTLIYTAGSGGTLTGETDQTVEDTDNGTAVTAVPDSGYAFTSWSDASTDNPRTDLNVTDDITVSATFTLIPVVSNNGPSSSGSSAKSRIKNLVAMNKIEEAKDLITQFPNAINNNEVNQTTPSIPNPTCSVSGINKTLFLGSRGEDVRILQKLLNCLGFGVASTGSGSAGFETTVFGTRTRNAVIRFQEQYASEILILSNTPKATGIFGEFSRKIAAKLTGN